MSEPANKTPPKASYSEDLVRHLKQSKSEIEAMQGSKRPEPPSERPRLNIYQCQSCLGITCTVDRDRGTTPFSIMCNATGGCRGTMLSGFYMVHPMLQPTFEWYAPAQDDPAVTNDAIAAHVAMGGLLLRKIQEGSKS